MRCVHTAVRIQAAGRARPYAGIARAMIQKDVGWTLLSRGTDVIAPCSGAALRAALTITVTITLQHCERTPPRFSAQVSRCAASHNVATTREDLPCQTR